MASVFANYLLVAFMALAVLVTPMTLASIMLIITVNYSSVDTYTDKMWVKKIPKIRRAK